MAISFELTHATAPRPRPPVPTDDETPGSIDDAILASATAPRRVQVGSESVEQHPIADLIAADRYVASKQAATRRDLGLYFRQLIPS